MNRKLLYTRVVYHNDNSNQDVNARLALIITFSVIGGLVLLFVCVLALSRFLNKLREKRMREKMILMTAEAAAKELEDAEKNPNNTARLKYKFSHAFNFGDSELRRMALVLEHRDTNLDTAIGVPNDVYDYISTLELDLKDGRFFRESLISREHSSDANKAYAIAFLVILEAHRKNAQDSRALLRELISTIYSKYEDDVEAMEYIQRILHMVVELI